jgi:hypothetical protein
MEESFVPLRGIKNDLHGRLACYKQDWTGGFRAGIRCEQSASFVCSLAIVLFVVSNLVPSWPQYLGSCCGGELEIEMVFWLL